MNDSKTQALLIHVLSIFFGFIPGLIFLLAKKDDAFVQSHAKESLNFVISFFVYYLIAFVLTFVVIGAFMMPIIGIAYLVLAILAAVNASKGLEYKFPLVFVRLIK